LEDGRADNGSEKVDDHYLSKLYRVVRATPKAYGWRRPTWTRELLVETMVRFANEHGAMVIAEGVERKEEYEMVKSLGVHLVQGFFVHRPSTSGVSYRPPIHPAPALAEGAK